MFFDPQAYGRPQADIVSTMKIVGCVGICLLSTLSAQGDTLSYGKPDDVGVSNKKLLDASEIMKAFVEADLVRGCVLLVARNHKVIFHEAYGWRDLAKKRPMKKDTLFRMASNSKAPTALAVLMLAEQGALKLDDRIHDYFLSFDHGQAAEISIRQLLTHTGGMGSALFMKGMQKGTSLQKEVARFGVRGISSEPGQKYSYSNEGYNTLAGLIEVAGKSGYKEFLKRRIYDPLKMVDSCNHETDADQDRMSAVFVANDKGKLRARWKPGDPPTVPIPRGSGGMISTAYDYAVFCQMYLNGGTYGGTRLLSEDNIAAAVRSQKEHIPAAKNYGFGWGTSKDTFSHTGSDGTASYANLRHNLIVLVFTQTPSKKIPRKEYYRAVVSACSDPDKRRP